MNQEPIPKADLVQGHWYVGLGRFAGSPQLGLWNSEHFVGLTFKWGQWTETSAVYGDQGFTPILDLNNV